MSAPTPTPGYVALVRGVLQHTHGVTLNEASERAYLARCERAELSPRIVADIIAAYTSRPEVQP